MYIYIYYDVFTIRAWFYFSHVFSILFGVAIFHYGFENPNMSGGDTQKLLQDCTKEHLRLCRGSKFHGNPETPDFDGLSYNTLMEKMEITDFMVSSGNLKNMEIRSALPSWMT